tara:strand:- start:214 stop:435 length:222 start_codon:yes stop_codon:yes gene_type:complete
MTRDQHLQWAKDRAKALLNSGDIAGGMASFTSDMGKHEGTKETLQNGISHIIIMQALMTNNASDCIACVDGFN